MDLNPRKVTMETNDWNNLKDEFSYHNANQLQLECMAAIRESAFQLAVVISNCSPRCADQSAAIRKIREAMMTANAAVSTHPGWYK